MRILLSLLHLFTYQTSLWSQSKLCGQVLDGKKNQAIPYANIGIPSAGIGTVSNELGHFCIIIPDSLSNQTLLISSLAYTKASVDISTLNAKETITITLEPNAILLADVTIKPKKSKILGNKIDSKIVSAGFNSNTLGCEVGVIYKPRKKTVRIKDFNFNVVNTKYDSVWYRINVYELNKDGLPGQNILQENVIGAITKVGWVKVDLLPYQLITNKNFVVSLEWIKDPGNGDAGLYFSAGFLTGNPFFARRASQDKWEKLTAVSLGFYTTVEY